MNGDAAEVMKAVVFEGGLTEVVRACYESDRYERLCRTEEMMGVVLAGTNPFLGELFQCHPNRSRWVIVDLHGQVDRLADAGLHGPERRQALLALAGFSEEDVVGEAAECRPTFFAVDAGVGEGAVVIQPFAGSSKRSLPTALLRRIVRECLRARRTVHIVTRDYPRWRRGVQMHGAETLPPGIAALPGVVWHASLSVPGTLCLIQQCAMFIGCHGALLQAAWHQRKPTLALYPEGDADWTPERVGKAAAWGAGSPGCAHQAFSAFDAGALREQLAGLNQAAPCASAAPDSAVLRNQVADQARYVLRIGDAVNAATFFAEGWVRAVNRPDLRRWEIGDGMLRLLGEDGSEKGSAKPRGAEWVGEIQGQRLEFHPAPLRRYLVCGLQRSCTNLFEHYFRTRLDAPRVTQFHDGKVYWKHGWLPAATELRDVFVIVCVRHPLHWLTACFDYFQREHGKDGTVCGKFDPQWTFEEWLERPHYQWPCPAERWNTLNAHWLQRASELGPGAVVVRAEDCQTQMVQRATMRRVLALYDPLLPDRVLDGFIGQRLTNSNRTTNAAMNPEPYLHETYLARYPEAARAKMERVLDAGLMASLGYGDTGCL